MSVSKKWWKEAIVYQIYPRSFNDSNGDGVGDLRGIIEKLDYIESLGINVVWLNPIYSSPNDDNGYDISDYQNIMSEFGTMEDFNELLEGLHQRGIKLIMDLVVNHCSDEHFWFQESRKSRDNPYRDYFHWVPAENGKPNERWSFFDPEGDAWKYDETTNAYYLHYFSQKQPDLKWENPKVRSEIYDMMHFWFKKGIDGFRMDVITFISKDLTYPSINKGKSWESFYGNGPHLHDYLQEMNREVLRHYDIMTVAEGPGTSPETVLDLVSEDRQELNMSYHFDHPYLGIEEKKMLTEDYKNLRDFKAVHTKWDAVFAEKGWGTIYLGNHDQPRMVSRWTDDSPAFRVAAAKMLNTWILSMRGTPYLYQGDEIGMTNIKFDDIEDYRDLETINWYHLIKSEGGDTQKFLDSHKVTARDNGRTPLQWNDTKNAGFTTGIPWIKVNKNHAEVNVAAQEINPDSVLNYFRKMVRLKRDNEILIYGTYKLLAPNHSQIYAFLREYEEEKWLVILNFSNKNVSFEMEEIGQIKREIINNYSTIQANGILLQLQAYQAVIFAL